MPAEELMNLKLARVADEAEGVVSLELVSPSGSKLPAFTAGSHIDLHISKGCIRQYSLCNDPGETHRYVVGVLREPKSRGGSQAIHERFREGDTVQVGIPRNNFPLIDDAKHTILIGGGIGITPILSMAWRLTALNASFELHYCTRSLARTPFKSLIKSAPFSGRIVLHLDDGSDEQRFRCETVIAGPSSGLHLYACGPSAFMDYVVEGAKLRGLTEGQIHIERFSGSISSSGEEFSVRAVRSGQTVQVAPDMTIAQALLAAGVDVPLSCEQGVCGTCLTSVIEGIPEHRDVYQSDCEKATNKQIAICCSRARTSMLVLDI